MLKSHRRRYRRRVRSRRLNLWRQGKFCHHIFSRCHAVKDIQQGVCESVSMEKGTWGIGGVESLTKPVPGLHKNRRRPRRRQPLRLRDGMYKMYSMRAEM